MIKLIVSLALIGVAFGGQCPPHPDDIYPCECRDNKIYCTSVPTDTDLDQVFKNLMYNQGEQGFEALELSSFGDQELNLTDNMFEGVWFTKIILNNNKNLDCVEPGAFRNMELHTTDFISKFNSFKKNKILDIGKPWSCDLFAAISKLSQLRVANITETEITGIPDNAFQPIGGHHLNLQSIDFSNTIVPASIMRIGKNAFSQLNRLQYIGLSSQKICNISGSAFEFFDNVDIPLTIDLQNNQLTGTSFESSFTTSGRRINLLLNGNVKLNYLDENVFSGLVSSQLTDNRVKIDLTGCQLENCLENKWLIEKKIQYKLEDKLINAMMSGGPSLWKTQSRSFNKTCRKDNRSLCKLS